MGYGYIGAHVRKLFRFAVDAFGRLSLGSENKESEEYDQQLDGYIQV